MLKLQKEVIADEKNYKKRNPKHSKQTQRSIVMESLCGEKQRPLLLRTKE